MRTIPFTIMCLMLAATTVTGCSSTHSAADSSASGDAATAAPDAAATSATPVAAAGAPSPSSDPYPDWAAAVAPDYPNRVDQQAVTTGFYQIDSPDGLATVAAWYKSHTTGGTWKRSDPDSPEEWFYDGPNGVKIDVQANHSPVNNPGMVIKTMIAFTQKQP